MEIRGGNIQNSQEKLMCAHAQIYHPLHHKMTNYPEQVMLTTLTIIQKESNLTM